MDIETNWDALSAISTFIAAIIALGLALIPPIIRQSSERKLATNRCLNRFKTVQLVVKKYRYYNVQKIVQDGFVQFQYDVNNAKSMTINIDLYQEATNLNLLSESLGTNTRPIVSETVDLLIGISSGFPFHKEDWDRLEVSICNSISVLENELKLL